MNESVISSKHSEKINNDDDEEGSEKNGHQEGDDMDEDGIRKIQAVIIEDKPGDYHLSTGNAYPDPKHELGIKPRRSKKTTESGEVESKSVVISNNSNNMHASMNTRDSSKLGGAFRSSKSMLLYD
jgi:hypothetical protein